MRIFGGDRMKTLMSRLKVPEDQPIEAGIISSALEKAQSKVEGMHFDLRKHVLEYDDVIAKHRQRIYNQRNDVSQMNYDQLKEFVLAIVKEEIEKILDFGGPEQKEAIKTILPLAQGVSLVKPVLFELAEKIFKGKEEKEGKENIIKILRFAVLKTTDMFWSEHLYTLDSLKDSVRLRAYGGKDPLIEYKTESHRLFQDLQNEINHQIARTVFKLTANN